MAAPRFSILTTDCKLNRSCILHNNRLTVTMLHQLRNIATLALLALLTTCVAATRHKPSCGECPGRMAGCLKASLPIYSPLCNLLFPCLSLAKVLSRIARALFSAGTSASACSPRAMNSAARSATTAASLSERNLRIKYRVV